MNFESIMNLAEGCAFDVLEESVVDKYTITIPTGHTLFHGSEKEIKTLKNTPTWFGEVEAISETYGDVVSEFETTKPLKCLNFRENNANLKRMPQGYAISGTDSDFKRMVIELHKGKNLSELKSWMKKISESGLRKYATISDIGTDEFTDKLIGMGFDGVALDDEPSYGSRGSNYPAVFVFNPSDKMKFVTSYEV